MIPLQLNLGDSQTTERIVQDQAVMPYATLWIAALVALITSAATLAGVYLTQRASRRNQQLTIEANAALER